MPGSSPIQAIAFDAYGTLFDVYSVSALAEQHFPGKGEALAALWRLKQIEYTQLRTLAGRYEPFWEITRDALVFAARRLALSMPETIQEQLLNQYACLSPFPENAGALKTLKAAGIPLAVLSNGTPRMLQVALRSAGLDGVFDHILSVDDVRRYKPHPATYSLGLAAFGYPARNILFVSSNGWDVAGAAWFGYTTFWINRGGQPAEELGIAPDATGSRLTDVAAFAHKHRAAA